MSWLLAVFLGLVQGVAEFLPISSSGHLALFQSLFGLEEAPVFFDVLLHFGTLLSLCVFYWRDIADMAGELVRGVRDLAPSRRRHTGRVPKARRLVLLLIVACLPLFPAVFFSDTVEFLLQKPMFIGLFLCLTGAVLFVSDRLRPGTRKDETNATVGDALLVGVCQGVAILPGLSRSGMTISGGLLRRFDRAFAVRFSFLLSLPAVLGATLLQLFKELRQGFDTTHLPVYLLGMAVAAVSGYFAIGLVKRLVVSGKFGGFAYYCLAVGAIAIVLSFLL
ncbi:MAG: undecaprenyl-diphosphate phosphatase [Oscillospiraceae bacterium]|jgi:undecaprenyl-diphosphatase|nr:undecaprenyl-diphosphate phosphatase [Oscillospiraceae bacterium]